MKKNDLLMNSIRLGQPKIQLRTVPRYPSERMAQRESRVDAFLDNVIALYINITNSSSL